MAMGSHSYWIFPLVLAGLNTPALANEYLTEVTSEVYETTGTPREIATRANTCIAQHLVPGTVDAQLIISSDLDNGIVVARNALQQAVTFDRWQIRSRFTFEARDGRFRITQTALERFGKNWDPIGKWPGSQWKGAEAAFKASADKVAQCVLNVSARDEW